MDAAAHPEAEEDVVALVDSAEVVRVDSAEAVLVDVVDLLLAGEARHGEGLVGSLPGAEERHGVALAAVDVIERPLLSEWSLGMKMWKKNYTELLP